MFHWQIKKKPSLCRLMLISCSLSAPLVYLPSLDLHFYSILAFRPLAVQETQWTNCMHCKSSHVMLSKLKSGYLATRVSEWDGGRDETRDNGRRDKWVREKWFHVACSEKRKLDSENRASNLERTLTCSFFPHAVQNQYVSYLWWSSKVAMWRQSAELYSEQTYSLKSELRAQKMKYFVWQWNGTLFF